MNGYPSLRPYHAVPPSTHFWAAAVPVAVKYHAVSWRCRPLQTPPIHFAVCHPLRNPRPPFSQTPLVETDCHCCLLVLSSEPLSYLRFLFRLTRLFLFTMVSHAAVIAVLAVACFATANAACNPSQCYDRCTQYAFHDMNNTRPVSFILQNRDLWAVRRRRRRLASHERKELGKAKTWDHLAATINPERKKERKK